MIKYIYDDFLMGEYMKKIIAAILALSLAAGVFCGFSCGINDGTDDGDDGEVIITPEPKPEDSLSAHQKINLSADGYVRDGINDFSVYEGTSAYRKVTTAEELLSAIADATYHYKNVWDEDTGTYTQVPADGYTEENFEGAVRVIEIANDINLGYNVLSAEAKATGLVSDFASSANKLSPYLYMSDNFNENGISQIKVERVSNLLIYSKNGAKLTHCGFKLSYDNNVVFRNLEFDEIWQWEDGTAEASKIGDYDWFGWAYFKIAFCGYIWIDHCTFGKSYDGQIDVSNPEYTANAQVAACAPYGADGSCAVHISWCKFNAGSEDEDGYIYQTMQAIEEEYQAHTDAEDGYVSKHAYYDALRDGGVTFEEILYGIAIPQKKGFLCGDSGDDYKYNLKLQVSFANCTFKNLEDRIPKLRGGNAYMYNCVVDSSEYYAYRTRLRSKSAASLVSKINSSWKCGLVSQGIVCGNGGSVKAENCIFRGVENLLKNNDSNSADKVIGGYELINCSYKLGANSTEIVGSSPDKTFPNSSAGTLKTEYFSWHTEDGLAPFIPSVTALNVLGEYLADVDYGAGAHTSFKLSLLKSKY